MTIVNWYAGWIGFGLMVLKFAAIVIGIACVLAAALIIVKKQRAGGADEHGETK